VYACFVVVIEFVKVLQKIIVNCLSVLLAFCYIVVLQSGAVIRMHVYA